MFLHSYMKKLFHLLLLCGSVKLAAAQTDSLPVYHVGLMLPFQTQASLKDIEDFFSAPDYFTASHISIDNFSVEALDFYRGTLQALQQSTDSLHINLHVYDCWNSDSVTWEWLKNPELKKLDVIIGPSATSNARLVAEFCNKNKIINLQPFTPSKSLTNNNPYHVKLAPTIDAHIDNLFLSVLDSFTTANVIIYAPDNDLGASSAQRLDSLFKDYNATATTKFNVVNATAKKLAAVKKSLGSYIKNGADNLLFITAFEGSFVNGTLRNLIDEVKEANIIVYGMPTWPSSEIIRLDYLNTFHTRISEPFYADTAKERTNRFISEYTTQSGRYPSEMAFMGFDVTQYLLYMLASYGKDFPTMGIGERYIGTGYKFDVVKETSSTTQTNYFENRHVNVFKIEDYRLQKIW